MIADVDAAINELYNKFNECESIKEINSQLLDGLIGSVEHARYVLQAWEEYKRLPQNDELVRAFPSMF